MKRSIFMCIAIPVILLLLASGAMASDYEVVLIRGKVSFKGAELKKGSRIEISDLDNPANMKSEIKNFTFGTLTDEIHLLDRAHQKIILVSARNSKPGRDFMLATRGMKYLKSDFEFKRAFTPENAVITLLTEDTVLCKGLSDFQFTGNVQLVVNYTFNGQGITKIIGRNDSLFLTRNHFFGTADSVPINSFEAEGITLSRINAATGKEVPFADIVKPFSILFLDDIISYLAGVNYNGLKMDEDAVYNYILPEFVNVKQIQREFGFYSEDEAYSWLHKQIQMITGQN